MAAIDDAVKINGAKYRSYQKTNGDWSDPLESHNFWSRTFLPKGTKFIEAQDKAEMIAKIKADKTIQFKEAELSKETIIEFDKANISYEATAIEGKISIR